MDPFEIKDALQSFRIIADTREQRTPRAKERFEAFGVPIERATLSYGDYAANITFPDGSSLQDINQTISAPCVIERKMSIDELAGCFGRGRERFQKEFQRAKDAGASVYLLIEDCSFEAILRKRYHSRFNPDALMASLIAWVVRYDLKPIFCKAGSSGRVIKEILYRDIKERLECDAMDEKKSFLLYTEYFEQIEMLSIEQRGILLTAIMAYQLEKDLPDMDAMTRMCYSFISADMRRNNEKYARIVERRREAGQKGGRIAQANRANQANQANATFAQANQANQADNVNVNENDNDNENVNVNVSVNENAPSGYSGKDTTTQSNKIPTMGDIKAYCKENGIETNVVDFFLYNNNNGWKMDWKEALTKWVSHDKKDTAPKKKPNQFNDNFPARGYTHDDFEEIERRLLQVKGT